MQSRALAPTMKTMRVGIFQRPMAKSARRTAAYVFSFFNGCQYVKKDSCLSETGCKQADTLNVGESPKTDPPNLVFCQTAHEHAVHCSSDPSHLLFPNVLVI